MAVSIKNEGMINPIEADKDLVIITGEVRWRAAKKAGLAVVPVKIIESEGMERFIRQIQENIHHNTMSPLDTAKALKKILDWLVKTNQVKAGKKTSENYGSQSLVRLLGVAESSLNSYLNLLKESPEIQKIFSKKSSGFVPLSSIVRIRALPIAYQDEMRRKVIKTKISSEGLRYLVDKIRILDKEKKFSLANELMKKDYSGMSAIEMMAEINRTCAGIQHLENDQETAKKIRETIEMLSSLMKKRPLHTFQPLFRISLVSGTTFFVGELLEWLEDTSKVKQLLNKNYEGTKN